MVEDVAKRLNYAYSYSHMFYGASGTGTYEMGVAILSKFRILETIEFKYERASTDEILEANVKDRYNLPRKLLGVKLDLGGRELWVFTTNFTITPNALPTDQQIKEAIKVKAFLADYDGFVLCLYFSYLVWLCSCDWWVLLSIYSCVFLSYFDDQN